MTDHVLSMPVLNDSVLEADFFDAARAGDLLVQRCSVCSRSQFYPRILCRHCGSEEVRWQKASKRGEIYSWSEVFRPTAPDDDARFTLLLVTLDEGPRLLCRMSHQQGGTASIGDRVRLTFETYGSEGGLQLIASLDKS